MSYRSSKLPPLGLFRAVFISAVPPPSTQTPPDSNSHPLGLPEAPFTKKSVFVTLKDRIMLVSLCGLSLLLTKNTIEIRLSLF